MISKSSLPLAVKNTKSLFELLNLASISLNMLFKNILPLPCFSNLPFSNLIKGTIFNNFFIVAAAGDNLPPFTK